VEIKVAIPALQEMKRQGRKIVGVVVYDFQMAQIVDRAGVDIVSVGDSVGMNLWGQRTQLEVTLDQMILTCQAVRRGVSRALVSCDLPFGPLQQGTEAALSAASRLTTEGGADMVKVDGGPEYPDAIRAIVHSGIPVWGQFGITPHTAHRYGGIVNTGPDLATQMKDHLLEDARLLERCGASMLDFTNSGPVAGAEVARTISIPVIGGLGGGPWLDGRVRSLFAAIGYSATAVDDKADRYANVADLALNAIRALIEDVRAGRQIRGGAPA